MSLKREIRKFKIKALSRMVKNDPFLFMYFKDRQLKTLSKTRAGIRKVVRRKIRYDRGYSDLEVKERVRYLINLRKSRWSKSELIKSAKATNPLRGTNLYLSKRGRRAIATQKRLWVKYINKGPFSFTQTDILEGQRAERVADRVTKKQMQAIRRKWNKINKFYNKPLIRGR